MRQPLKKENVLQPDKTDKKRVKKTLKQPIKSHIEFFLYHKLAISKQDEKNVKERREKVTTSKLEYVFMRQFLDKYKFNYIHQFLTKSKFVYDFAILTPDGGDIQGLVEVDGDFWHSNPILTEKQGFLYENQKRQINRDKAKDEWAAMNGFILLRFYENDIKNNPKKVLEELKKRFYTKK